MRALKAGAKWGAITGGLLGFLIGIAVCIRFKVPIPPLAGSEVGILLGVSIGMLIALICRTRAGRMTLASFGVGSVLGVPVALSVHGHFPVLTWMSMTCLMTFLGYQSSQLPSLEQAEPWRLH